MEKYCDHCGLEMDDKDIVSVGSEHICKSCIKKHYITCECGKIVSRQYYYPQTKDCVHCSTEDRGFNI